MARSSIHTLKDAQIVIEAWRTDYAVRRHASLVYRPPARKVFMSAFVTSVCAKSIRSDGHAPRWRQNRC